MKPLKMNWRFRFSHKMPRRPRPMDGALWYFDFPVVQGGSVHYLTQPYSGPMVGSVTMTVEVIPTSGTPVFKYLGPQGGLPANVRPYFDTGNMYSEFGRWWSNPATIELKEGAFTVDVPLTPDLWSSVYGKFGSQYPGAFKQAKKNVAAIGMTFGGGFSFGHGVTVRRGKAKFVLKEYSI